MNATITRSQQLATTAIGIIGATGLSGVDPATPEFGRAVDRFTGPDAVFTRSIHTRADDGATEGEPENVETTDGEAFSFDAIASRGSKRLMWHPVYRRIVWEVLTISPESVDTSVVEAQRGLPFYRDHMHWDGARLGRVSSLEVTDGEIVARGIRLSRHDDVKRYRMDVADKLTGGVSLGYRHKRSELIEADENELYPTCLVHEIIPVELSATDMPADILCGIIETSIRSASEDVPETAITGTRAADAAGNTATRADHTQETATMTTPTTAPAGASQTAPAAQADVVTRSDQPVVTPSQTPAPAPADGGTTFDASAFATRSAELVTIARQANLADDVLTSAIADPTVTVDAFRAQAFQAIVGRQSTAVTVGNDVATRGDRLGAMIDAIVARSTGTAPEGLAQEYMRHNLADMAHESLTAAGHTIHRNDREEIFTRTFHVTSDFGEALRGALPRILIQIGGNRQLQYQTVAAERDLPNFLPNKAIDVDGFPGLKLLREGGEIQHGTIGTGEFDVILQTFARALRVSRQAFVNDGLGIFPQVVQSLGQTLPQQQNDIVFAALTLEIAKVLADKPSKALLPGTNLLEDGTELSHEALNAAIVLMGKRKRRDGSYSAVAPRYLVTGFDLRAKAIEMTTANLAALGKVNTNTDLTPVLDPSIEGNTWFVMADPQAGTPAMQYGGLVGKSGPIVNPWERVRGYDGVEMEVILDFYGAMVSSHAIAGSIDAAAYEAAQA